MFGESASLGEVTANLQWEVISGGVRPDILLYNRDTAGSPMELVEAKLSKGGNGDEEARDQLTRYQRAFPKGPGDQAVAGRVPVFSVPAGGQGVCFDMLAPCPANLRWKLVGPARRWCVTSAATTGTAS